MSSVSIREISKQYGGLTVLPSFSLDIPNGSFTVIVGPSGCGKSTLLRIIAGLERTSSGTLCIGDRDVTDVDAAERGIAMVFQSYALYPHMTVAQNIGFPLRMLRTPREEAEQRIRNAAEILQLEHLLDRKPKALSGGQRQRVAIGRAIVREPAVFLFDEPLSNLDAAMRTQMRVDLAQLHRRLNATMIYVTHDQVEALTLADQIVVMNAGRVEQVGAPMELYEKPNTEFVASFLGAPKMNLLKGDLAKSYGVDTVGVRPEHIEIGLLEGGWRGHIRHFERLGASTVYYLDLSDGQQIIVTTPGDSIHPIGSEIGLHAKAERLHFFTAGIRKN